MGGFTLNARLELSIPITANDRHRQSTRATRTISSVIAARNTTSSETMTQTKHTRLTHTKAGTMGQLSWRFGSLKQKSLKLTKPKTGVVWDFIPTPKKDKTLKTSSQAGERTDRTKGELAD